MYKLSTTDGRVQRNNLGNSITDMPIFDPDYQEWLAKGNTPEPAETTTEKKSRLISELRSKRDSLLFDSDKMMLSDFPNGNSHVIIDYRQNLRDMPDNHTTIANLEKPEWPSQGK